MRPDRSGILVQLSIQLGQMRQGHVRGLMCWLAAPILIAATMLASAVQAQQKPAKPTQLPEAPRAGIVVEVENDPARLTAAVTKPTAKTGSSSHTPVAPTSLAPKLLPEQTEHAKAIAPTDVHPASFQGIMPGRSTREQVLGKLSKPTSETEKDGQCVLTFKVGPFPRVEVTLVDDVVQSLVVHLAAPGSRDSVAKELKMDRFKSVPVSDESGQLLGEVFPERGLTFVYQMTAEPAVEKQVSHVALESITPEPFLLRAQQEAEDQYTACLSDLQVVHQLVPRNAIAYGLEATVHAKCGRVANALEAAEKALELKPDNVEYQLAIAELWRQRGRFEEALQLSQRILANEALSPLDAAAAKLQWGKLLATMPPRDYRRAMEQTVASVKVLAARDKAGETASRKRTRRLLVDAELWLARIIANGPWKKKHGVAPQWLASAEQATRDLIKEQEISEAALLDVYRTSLECLDVLNGKGDPGDMANAAITLGRRLIAEAEDEDFRASVEWELGTCLLHAAQVVQYQGKPGEALRYANNASALLESASKQRIESPRTDYRLAQLQFLIGSIYALHKKDHATAITWYQKALPALEKSPPTGVRDQRGLLGDELTSIGVSLWETGSKTEAIALTEKGTQQLQKAIESGTLSEQVLVVPLENLAAMHRALGNKQEAQLLANRAAKIEPRKKPRKIIRR